MHCTAIEASLYQLPHKEWKQHFTCKQQPQVEERKAGPQRRIERVEGRARGVFLLELHPLQQNFLEMAALQCGICTPGVLIAAKALLDENPDPTETEVRFWLAGNLCRCTGYDKIVRAVLSTAQEMRETAQ